MNNISLIGKHCFGCRACELKCPQNCIEMKENEEGFIYSIIDYNKCINCGLCLQVCPANEHNTAHMPMKIYAMISKNRQRLVDSASGGMSDVLANHIISNGGIVFGVAYTENMKPVHIFCETHSDLKKIQSSKYVAADTGDTFIKVKNELSGGKLVLYTGTSCQIKGLEMYLGKYYENLITLSIICHGTPSFKVFRAYLDSIESKYKSKVVNFDFRFKGKNKWALDSNHYSVLLENKKAYSFDSNYTLYGKDFIKGVNLRESCYQCRFSTANRVGDFSVGDFWGYNKNHNSFYDEKGLSIVVVNNNKALKMVDMLVANDKIIIEEVDIDDYMNSQPRLKSPFPRPEERNIFYKNNLTDRYLKHKLTLKRRIKILLKKILPSFVISIIKK